MSAVSKKLIPSSRARWKCGRAAASSRIQGRQPGSPYVMHPSASLETLRPLRPRRTCSMFVPEPLYPQRDALERLLRDEAAPPDGLRIPAGEGRREILHVL